MNIRILAAVALLGTALAAQAHADDRGWRGGGHWSHDSRGGARAGGPWNHDSRGYYGNRGWDGGRYARPGWNGGRDAGWRPAPRPYYRGWAPPPSYAYAPRYHGPYEYSPGYYAPGSWGGWLGLDVPGLVIQLHLP